MVLFLILSLLTISVSFSVRAAVVGESAFGALPSLAASHHDFHALQFHDTGFPGDGVIYQAFPPNSTHGPSIRAVGLINSSTSSNSTGGGGSRRLLQVGLRVPSYHFPFDTNYNDAVTGIAR